MVEDIKGDKEQKIRQKAHDEVFTETYNNFLIDYQDYEEKMNENGTARGYTRGQKALVRTLERND